MKHDDLSYFDDVGDFMQKFGLPHVSDGPPRFASHELMIQRLSHMEEELEEASDALFTRPEPDLAAFADALADLVYVALGTAHVCGIPFERVWQAVHEANMKKARPDGLGARKQGVVKPEGWQPPDIKAALWGSSMKADKHVCDETCIPWCPKWPSGEWAEKQSAEHATCCETGKCADTGGK